MKRINNPYPGIEGYNCFGCSPNNPIGLQMEFIEDRDFIISKWDPDAHFGGYKNVLHGGIQATLLDEIASWCVQVKLKTAGVTANLNIRYKHPVFTDRGTIILKAKIEKTEKRLAYVNTFLIDHDQKTCCYGVVTYYLYPEKIAREKLYYPGFDRFFE